jgi:hypothetical protein
MRCQHTVCSWHPVYWWGGIHQVSISHNTRVWVDDNPHITVASRYQCLGGHPKWSTIRTYVTDQQVQCTITFWWMIYQYSWNISLFMNINRSSSCMIGRRGPVNWPAWSPDFNPLDFWLWEHVNSLVYSAPISDLRGITATGIESLWGDSNKTWNFRQSAHLCALKIWKLCWNA